MVLPQHVRRWSNLSSGLSMIRACCLFCKDCLWRKRSSIADTVAVAEVSVLPLHLQEVLMHQGTHQGATVAKLGAAGGRRGTTISPLHYVCPEKRFRTLSPIKCGATPERVGSTGTLSCSVAKQATVNEGHDETCDQDLSLIPIPHPKGTLPNSPHLPSSPEHA